MKYQILYAKTLIYHDFIYFVLFKIMECQSLLIKLRNVMVLTYFRDFKVMKFNFIRFCENLVTLKLCLMIGNSFVV